MPLRRLGEARGLLFRVTGPEDSPVAVYLPGVHGDWTPNERARPFLSAGIRLIEVAYPRTPGWQLSDFVLSLGDLLDTLGVESAHLIGESFGSLVGWEVALNQPHRVRSLLLVGGFAQPPAYRLAGSAKWALRFLPTVVLETGIDAYVWYKNKGGEGARASGPGVKPYPATRTRSGKRATANRMAIIERTDVRAHLDRVAHPVRYLGGETDWVVPVHRELATLEGHLPEACGFQSHLIAGGPHAIIASHPETTATKLAQWVFEIEGVRRAASQ